MLTHAQVKNYTWIHIKHTKTILNSKIKPSQRSKLINTDLTVNIKQCLWWWISMVNVVTITGILHFSLDYSIRRSLKKKTVLDDSKFHFLSVSAGIGSGSSGLNLESWGWSSIIHKGKKITYWLQFALMYWLTKF